MQGCILHHTQSFVSEFIFLIYVYRALNHVSWGISTWEDLYRLLTETGKFFHLVERITMHACQISSHETPQP